MAQALTAFVIFMVVAGGIIISLNRRTRSKMQEAVIEGGVAAEPAELKPRNLSRRQQRVVATLEPMKDAPSIEALVEAEAADTGVNEIRGGEGLDVSLKLRVFWRDEVVRQGCEDGSLEFRVEEGVDPASAETDDVRLVCVRNGVDQATPTDAASPSEEVAQPSSDSDIGSDGNFAAGLDVD